MEDISSFAALFALLVFIVNQQFKQSSLFPLGSFQALTCEKLARELCSRSYCIEMKPSCDSTMCCAVNTLKELSHPCVWCLDAGYMSERHSLMRSSSRK